MDKLIHLLRLVLLLISGVLALSLFALMTFDNERNYDGLAVLLCLPGAIVAVVALTHVFRHRYFTLWGKTAVVFNSLALAYWLFWIGLFATFWVTSHEPGAFKTAFDQIHPGMTMTQVEALLDSLDPETKQVEEVPQGSLSYVPAGVEKYLIYYTSNHWKYRFYLDANGTVVKSEKWWD